MHVQQAVCGVGFLSGGLDPVESDYTLCVTLISYVAVEFLCNSFIEFNEFIELDSW